MRLLRSLVLLLLSFIAAFTSVVRAADEFVLDGIEAPRGTLRSGYLEMPPATDGDARIPVSVVSRIERK